MLAEVLHSPVSSPIHTWGSQFVSTLEEQQDNTYSFIETSPSNKVKEVKTRQGDIPKESQKDGSHSIVYRIGIESSILGVEGEETSFLLCLLPESLLL